MIITISGIDGSGKTTLANHVQNALVLKGYKVMMMEFPCSKMWAMIELLEKKGSYFHSYGKNNDFIGFALNLERFEYLYDYVQKNNEIYDIVILQRYIVDFAAIGKTQDAGEHELKLLYDIDKLINVPKQIYCIDITHEEAYKRILNRGASSDIREGKAFHKRLSKSYKEVLDSKLFNCTILKGIDSTEKMAEQIILNI